MPQLNRVWLVLLLLAQIAPWAYAAPGGTSILDIAVSELPPEGRETLRAVQRGGPFKFSRDGVVFGNYERILPGKPRGYYHEYTVATPGKPGRGARRIVCGPISECYYTADHYQSFRRIREQQ
jgi:ribonuclease T1